MTRLSYLHAVRAAQLEEMRRDPAVFVMGTDVTKSLLGSTVGFVDEFGPSRVRDTPISEGAIAGAAAGAAMVGFRPIADLAVSSFAYVAMDQIVSIIAKSRYLYGGQARLPLVLRSTMFYDISTAAQHSDRNYPMFMGVPGLKIIAPATAADAKGLLKAVIRSDDPVMCFEDRGLWGRQGEVSDDEDHVEPIGVAKLHRSGDDVTIVAIAGAVPLAIDAAEVLATEGISAEVLDPRTLVPLDRDAILESVARTGRLVIADPAHLTCSAASEISASVAQEGFWYLRAPIERVATPDIHIPFSPVMERGLYPTTDRIAEAARRTMR